MFTGLIEKVGKLAGLEKRSGGGILAVSHSPWDERLGLGDSVAVQGVCLTVVRCSATTFAVDVLEETLSKTTLGEATAGSALNLERALPANGRLGGHIVSGHVDGRGTIRSIARRGDDWVLEIGCPDELLRDIVTKGSIAVQGASLTVVDVGENAFSVHIIPHTWRHTSLAALQVGHSVNLETDILAKYVRRHLECLACGSAGSVTLGDLQKAGYA